MILKEAKGQLYTALPAVYMVKGNKMQEHRGYTMPEGTANPVISKHTMQSEAGKLDDRVHMK